MKKKVEEVTTGTAVPPKRKRTATILPSALSITPLVPELTCVDRNEHDGNPKALPSILDSHLEIAENQFSDCTSSAL